MTTAQETTDNERLARVEATQEALVREVGDVKLDMRQIRTETRMYFLALLTVMITMWVSLVVLLVSRT